MWVGTHRHEDTKTHDNNRNEKKKPTAIKSKNLTIVEMVFDITMVATMNVTAPS